MAKDYKKDANDADFEGEFDDEDFGHAPKNGGYLNQVEEASKLGTILTENFRQMITLEDDYASKNRALRWLHKRKQKTLRKDLESTIESNMKKFERKCRYLKELHDINYKTLQERYEMINKYNAEERQIVTLRSQALDKKKKYLELQELKKKAYQEAYEETVRNDPESNPTLDPTVTKLSNDLIQLDGAIDNVTVRISKYETQINNLRIDKEEAIQERRTMKVELDGIAEFNTDLTRNLPKYRSILRQYGQKTDLLTAYESANLAKATIEQAINNQATDLQKVSERMQELRLDNSRHGIYRPETVLEQRKSLQRMRAVEREETRLIEANSRAELKKLEEAKENERKLLTAKVTGEPDAMLNPDLEPEEDLGELAKELETMESKE